jgi:hypothetical protein
MTDDIEDMEKNWLEKEHAMIKQRLETISV